MHIFTTFYNIFMGPSKHLCHNFTKHVKLTQNSIQCYHDTNTFTGFQNLVGDLQKGCQKRVSKVVTKVTKNVDLVILVFSDTHVSSSMLLMSSIRTNQKHLKTPKTHKKVHIFTQLFTTFYNFLCDNLKNPFLAKKLGSPEISMPLNQCFQLMG
jgi:hypothetical protein